MSYPYFPFRVAPDGDKVVKVLSPYAGDEIKVNRSAAALLKLCNGSRSMDEIVTMLCDKFNSTEAETRGLAEDFIEGFSSRGIVWVKGEKMRWFDAPAPESVFWEITAECNLKCLHCIVSADKKQANELSTKEALSLINQWAAMGVRDITFSGGEPLMRADFFELARAAKEKGCTIGLATNGLCVTPDIAVKLRELEAGIQVSLDGSTAEIYGGFRGNTQAFGQAVKGIDDLVAAGNEVTVGMVISKNNVDDIPDMLDFAEARGVKYFRLIPFIPFGRGEANKGLELSPLQVKDASAYLIEERKKRTVDIITLEFEPTFSAPPAGKIDPSTPVECGGALHYCTVTPKGEVLPCHYFEGVVAENVKVRPFARIWKESRFLNYFRSMRVGDIKGYCGGCEWLAVCRSGCKAANFSRRALFDSNVHCWVVPEKV
ncbi:Radical SAM domain protein [hydrothermal vent metagenome]|uniref:Radical SAM domain protein n=1 Tax=hydrothermal vent metagenome TaxID=652676 RepID=A0A3B0VCQ1_9ZZZZ